MVDYDHDGHVFIDAERVSSYWDGPDNVTKVKWCLTCNKVVAEYG